MSSLPSPTRRPAWTSRFRPEVVLVAIVGVAILVVVIVSITGGDSFDRQAAVTRVVDDSSGRLTSEQASCYVDGVRREVGAAVLAPGAHPSDQQAARMTSIRVDCIGVTNLGADSSDATSSVGTAVPSTESGNLPRRVGDDAGLDALYAQCRDGVGQACDQLFDEAPVGSDYESFAVTCGNRTRELSCASVYVAPGVTNPAPTPAG